MTGEELPLLSGREKGSDAGISPAVICRSVHPQHLLQGLHSWRPCGLLPNPILSHIRLNRRD